MSWDGYIDNLVLQTKDVSGMEHCDKACIIGLDGGASWTTADHGKAIKLTAEEGKNIAHCFKSKDFSPFMQKGVIVEGIKYQFLRVEDDKMVLAKKKDCGALTIQCSKQGVVIAHTKEGCQQGCTNKGAAVISEYLESMNM